MLGAASAAHATVTLANLTGGQIAAFQSGATVQTFESVTGLPGFDITAFTSNVDTSTLTGSGLLLLQARAGGTGFITTSGGASPTGLFNLTGGLTGASSGTHVLAPLHIATQETCFDSTVGCFAAFEIIFEQPVQRVGFFMNRPATVVLENSVVTVDTSVTPPQISRAGATTIFSQVGIAAGFVAFTSTAADITGVSILMSGTPTFIDDLTYARAADTSGVPEPGTLLVAAGALAAMALRRRPA